MCGLSLPCEALDSQGCPSTASVVHGSAMHGELSCTISSTCKQLRRFSTSKVFLMFCTLTPFCLYELTANFENEDCGLVWRQLLDAVDCSCSNFFQAAHRKHHR